MATIRDRILKLRNDIDNSPEQHMTTIDNDLAIQHDDLLSAINMELEEIQTELDKIVENAIELVGL